MNFFLTINLSADAAAIQRIETKLDHIMSTQVAELTAIKTLVVKVGRELTGKIEKLTAELAASKGEMTPEAQAISDDIKSTLGGFDALVPDEPEAPAEPESPADQVVS